MVRKKYLLGILIAVLLGLYLRFLVPHFSDILAGPGWNEYQDYFDPWGMTNWILLYLPAWLLGLLSCENALNRAHMSVHRFRNVGIWWGKVFGGVIAYVGIVYVVLCACLMILAVSSEETKRSEVLICMLLIAVHALFSLAFAIWIRLLSGNMILAAVLTLVLEAMAKAFVVTKLLSPAVSIFSWGMYHYTHQVYGSGGFFIPRVLIIQAIIIVSPYIFRFGKGKEILLRRINDGKVH